MGLRSMVAPPHSMKAMMGPWAGAFDVRVIQSLGLEVQQNPRDDNQGDGSTPTTWHHRRRRGIESGLGYNPSMPSYPHIEQYRVRLQELIEFGGSDNEENIRPAFQNCLDSYCRDHREKLVLVPELKTSPSNKPDGTVKDSLRMARGYWEAKDSHDDLDAEIQAKFNRGYPQDDCKVRRLDRRDGRWSALGGRRRSWLAGAWTSWKETILPGAGRSARC